MSEQEDFLKRWSRRKREIAGDKEPESEQEKAVEAIDAALSNAADEPASGLANEQAGKNAAPVFDISKLPSIDSITAETDIRPFLAAGVPAHLTQAALRRLWVEDPKIRDFIEIAENQWDFNAGAIPGFDSSLPENVKELVAQIFTKTKEVVEEVGSEPTEPAGQKAVAQSPVSLTPTQIDAPRKYGSEPGGTASSSDTADPRGNAEDLKGAEQQVAAQDDAFSVPPPRRHGSALPS